MLLPQTMRRTPILTSISSKILNCLNGLDVDQLTSILVEYLFLSYGLNNAELSKFKSDYVFPKLKQLDLFQGWTSGNFKYYIDQLIEKLHKDIDQEIYLAQFFGFVFSQYVFFDEISHGDNKKDKKTSALNNIFDNYLSTSQKILDYLKIYGSDSVNIKSHFLDGIQVGKLTEPKLYSGYIQSGLILLATILVIYSFYFNTTIPDMLGMAAIMSFFMFLSLSQYDMLMLYNDKSFIKNFADVYGSIKFFKPVKNIVYDFLSNTNSSILKMINSTRIREESIAYEKSQPVTVSSSVTSSVHFKHDSSSSSSSHMDKLSSSKSTTSKLTEKMQKQSEIISRSKYAESRSIIWKMGLETREYDGSSYNQKYIPLWTLVPSSKALNNKFYVYWVEQDVKGLIKAEMGKEANKTYSFVSCTAHYGHIVQPIDKAGYVNCEKETERKHLLKLKIFHATFGSFRLFFNQVAKSGDKILLEPTSFKKTH